ncbi:nickel pincer cofactor biosynthesis protein LarC [Clostridiaceae bacterium UIB06]|uniref:Pyridinium-3,5-bisthiocarboxylic acid mononucleotide nickel insertion protein n=1 Tax=Clostridium thailandense TaxID=2794346 RepID=A0A949TKY3_9CLOT|nr:nickel pincer cofactor biosynthesis protein LarC [Clostridium thailandense]MBV7272387.1 nickel pincer cofactor biosynthesis protein LarC [Clostridium thailandense]MCH5135900.1 nickel pincer cofactor biosynthesis protein LarC [Clostridiaceae bacterium UIB06]
MRILYYDCFSGISGDMNLGALIDLGIDTNYLINELSKLNVNEYRILVKKAVKNGIGGTKVDVILHHNHHDDHSHHHHEHHHRNLKDIEYMIKSSKLNDNIKDISINIFKKVAEAEAQVHNKSIEEVHFHEVGAVDSIVDIVGAAICFDYLKVDKVICSTIEVGTGFVRCAHGTLPVPAPATAKILKNIPIRAKVPFEATTPTGAAIIAYLASEFTDSKDFIIKGMGYGIGCKENEDIPNVLRVFLAEKQDNSTESFLQGEVEVIECNIDDMNPELYDYVMELLFKEGALDVYLTPIIMKKGRPGVKLSVIYNEENEEKIKEIILTNTTTLGLRKYKAQRSMLNREFSKVQTKYGEFTIKSSYYNGKRIKYKAEYDECKKAALEKGISINEIYKELNQKIY